MTFTEEMNSLEEELCSVYKASDNTIDLEEAIRRKVELLYKEFESYREEISSVKKELDYISNEVDIARKEAVAAYHLGMKEGEVKGKVELLYKEFEYEPNKISDNLKIDILIVDKILEDMEKNFYS
ncbi:hypothetical protein AN639_02890 [Candidatus Epulonipiscium fishelsonii]|uniref:Uncharacterized protein n=1 Tax=Candidatus Epulonipiscium fishelsonii TaxID=77094 RepID=A0ACC8XCR0_9FIRM|nr:hypothetical protein AN396_05580 [Epulopiscium sp. SCG-B11WGA-EpuloA1]ONI41776.1 hypothetical protein AN639_02890 [Epulopiscium sp. SCG-B05WGA-EpuloA1]